MCNSARTLCRSISSCYCGVSQILKISGIFQGFFFTHISFRNRCELPKHTEFQEASELAKSFNCPYIESRFCSNYNSLPLNKLSIYLSINLDEILNIILMEIALKSSNDQITGTDKKKCIIM